MADENFEWPWQYSFPPFFTLQPNQETRRKQVDSWCHLVLNYFEAKKQTSVTLQSIKRLECPLFHNKNISRKLNDEAIMVILSELHKRGNLKWSNKQQTEFVVMWKTSTDWAQIIEAWVKSTGNNKSIFTIYDLNCGEDTSDQQFHGLEDNVIIDALKCLEKQGKAELFENDEGVKFLM